MMKSLIALALSLAALACPALAANPLVELKTSKGDLVVELYADQAPKSAENFLRYVKDGHYDGTIFHRVIDGFMVQGGGFDAALQQKPTRVPIENEASNGLKNEAGTLAMARTSDPHSATAQFFINLVPNPFLDAPGSDGWGYAVFGRVVKGMEVVGAIGKVATRTVGPYQKVPVEPVVIRSARALPPAGK